MSKSKSMYKNDLPNFFRKGSFDIKSIQGLNPQIFTIQAQSFINQNFFHGNTELLHDKSNNFISNLRKMSQKKLKSERTSSDLKKVTNKSATSLQGTSLIDNLPKKLKIRLNSSSQVPDPIKPMDVKSKKNSNHSELKQTAVFLDNLILASQAGNSVKQDLDDYFANLIAKNGNIAGILQIMKNCFEKAFSVIAKNTNELLEMKDGLEELNRKKEEDEQKQSLEISELKKMVETQNAQIEMLQAKEKQLIQFLLAIKSRGVIDLESIFNEEFNTTTNNNNKNNTNINNNNNTNNNNNNNTKSPKKLSNSLDKTNTRSKTEKTGLFSISKAVKDVSQEADVSIVNDSEESSFNYFGKSETSGQITPQMEQKKIERPPIKKPKALGDVFKLNLRDIQKESPENGDKKEEILPSDMENEGLENKKIGGNFKKKGEKNGIPEEMKENLLEKLKNFRKVYEKLAKK